MAGGYVFFKKLRGKILAFAADQNGVVLPYVTIVMAVLFGLAMLSTDMSRYLDLQTQLQKAADAFALAGAAELDGQPAVNGQGSAIQRANAAIDTLMANQNSSVFGTGAVTVSARNYYSQLPPAGDAANMNTGTVTTDPTQARFVSVQVAPVTINSLFPAALAGAATNAMTTSATAVAGFKEAVCRFTPLFICNPFEGQTPGIYDPANIGKQLTLKQGPGQKGTTGPYSPGNYGFLDSNGISGANALRDALGRNNPGACFSQDGVDTEPGQVASASDAINTRFDLYNGSANGWKTDPNYPPAQNVRKGCLYTGNACGENVVSDAPATTDYCNKYNNDYQAPPTKNPAYPLPQDSFIDPTTGVGNKTWDEAEYWLTNHGSLANNLPGGCPTAGTPCNTVSRYDVYKYEIANNLLTGAANTSPGSNAPGWTDSKKPLGETGAQQCNKSTPPANIDRRILYAAIIDCQAVGLAGGKQSHVPVTAFAKFFLIEPVDQTQNIYAEFQGILRPNNTADNVLHDIVQLYR